ncbi:hypothetical protein [Phenylobacterium sp.]|jgi:hypothetical protein|uniref:hypothetical protein n=1 Tax=Phenylobacterium sp. TaxID=1871053 RepID=UPI002F3FC7C3
MARPYSQARDPVVWAIGAAVFGVLIGGSFLITYLDLRNVRTAIEGQHRGARAQIVSVWFGRRTVCGAYRLSGDPHAWRYLTWSGGAWAEGAYPYARLPAATARAFQQCYGHVRVGGGGRGGIVVIYIPPARMLANLG